MKKEAILSQKLFLSTIIFGVLTCIPYIANAIGIGDLIQLAFIVITLVTLLHVSKDRYIKKKGLYFILASFLILLTFCIAIFSQQMGFH